MADVKERVARIEGQITLTLGPKAASTDENTKNIALMQQNMKDLENKTIISVQTNNLLTLLIEQERTKAVEQLKALIEEARGKQSPPPK
jgi:hypothetical protein